MITQYPCVLYELAPKDKGYEQGARLRLDGIEPDQQQFWFPTLVDADMFMDKHGFEMISEGDMETLREEHRTPRSDGMLTTSEESDPHGDEEDNEIFFDDDDDEDIEDEADEDIPEEEEDILDDDDE